MRSDKRLRSGPAAKTAKSITLDEKQGPANLSGTS